MSHLIKRLYETPLYEGNGEASELGGEAADKITSLTARVKELEEALEPFRTALKGNWSQQPDDMPIVAGFGPNDLRMQFTLGDFRRAAITPTPMDK